MATFPTIFKKITFIQKSVPRIFGELPVIVNVSNVNKVEFYLDDRLQFVDEDYPFEWNLVSCSGLHTLEVFAFDGDNISKDIIDIYILL